MSIEIPQNMDEVVMNIAREQQVGRIISEDEVIKTAVIESLQAFVDEAAEGHYDTIKWDGEKLIDIDIMGDQMGQIKPTGVNFIEDFRKDALGLMFRLEAVATKITRG
ncbi:Uncharacterized protein LACOL_0207 [Paucilactobacillus oligofermentans DSM 15707 = LMG 22743]|nr:hypothetical protein [Paucilactobacillus oligofermentans]CUS25515.1 Uncharacterized protein LACOL_0207 [Paucilactobacillus oligofermentans DSM 15707 = LMG 22743]